MGIINNIVNKGKNATLALGLESVFRNIVKEYAELLHFRFENSNRLLEFELKLKGEHSSLKVRIENYKIIRKNGKYFIIVSKVSTTREWLNILAGRYVIDREIYLPDEYATFYEMLT